MGYPIQRIGFRITRGWAVLLLITAGFIAAAFWIGPLRPLPAELQLLAVDARSDTLALAVVATTRRDTTDGSVRFGVPLAMRNVGARAARPQRLMLSLPGQFRLASSAGELNGEVTAGVPLRRYTVRLQPGTVPADSVPRRLEGLDTLWIMPELPSYYCTMMTDNIPEFIPAPERDAEALSDLRIFYSIRTADADERHSGLLAVRLDPALLRVEPAPMPPTFPTTFYDQEADVPELGTLQYMGTRTAYCGDPEQPIELYTVQWATGDGGHVYEVHVYGVARKRLYDVDGDDVVELETWDVGGDGFFEASQQARYRVPEFLVPPPPRRPEALLPDSVPPDSGWLALFHQAQRGIGRFAAAEPRHPPPSLALADTIVVDTLARAAQEAADTAGMSAVDPAWLQLFDNTAAGPFRFRPAAAPDTVPPDTSSVPATLSADTVPPDTVPPDTVAPPVRQPASPRPLGRPVRPDTIPQ